MSGIPKLVASPRGAANFSGSTIGRYLGFLAVIAMLSFAQVVQSAPRDCSETDKESPLKACEMQQLEEQDRLIAELDDLVSSMNSSPSRAMASMDSQGVENPLTDRLDRVKRRQSRGFQVVDESVNDDFEEMINQAGKQKGKSCGGWGEADEVSLAPENFVPPGLTLVPDSGLGDGKCGKFDALDGDANTVSINERSQPNICVKVCKDKEVKGQLKKDRVRNRHIARKSEGIDTTAKAADAVYAAKQKIQTMNIMAETAGIEYALGKSFPECELSPDADAADAFAFGAKLVLVPAVVALKLATRVADGIKDAGEAATQQDVVGNNVSTANIPAIVAAQVLAGSVDIVEFVIDELDLATAGHKLFVEDATHRCVAKIREEQDLIKTNVAALDGKVMALDGKVGGLSGDLEEVRRLIEENRGYIINTREIVLTPHGRRDNQDLYEP